MLEISIDCYINYYNDLFLFEQFAVKRATFIYNKLFRHLTESSTHRLH